MKNIRYVLSGLLLVILTACHAPSGGLSKYEFDDIPEVNSISNWSLDGWNAIDDRSLIVQTSPRDYYLLVLSFPNPNLRYALSIGISSSIGRVQAGFDTVTTPDSFAIKSTISKIYKLEDKSQVDLVTMSIQDG